MQFPFEIFSGSEAETAEAAHKFAEVVKSGDLVALNGNLGSGKTFFVKNFCEKFDIFSTESPTFAIVNEYSGTKKIIHMDFYRIKKMEELFDLGFEEYLNEENSIVLIEWAELFAGALPKERFNISMEFVKENTRSIRIERNR